MSTRKPRAVARVSTRLGLVFHQVLALQVDAVEALGRDHVVPLGEAAVEIIHALLRGFDRLRIGDALEPVTERTVADLVMVLQEIDERDRRKALAQQLFLDRNRLRDRRIRWSRISASADPC
jgi:hypothetical protein